MHATVFSGSVYGIDGFIVEVEVDISRGIPVFSIVGLPNTAVRESRERVMAAVKNSGWNFPLSRITVNLAPADIKKEGAAFDLAIAMGILACSGQTVPPQPGGKTGESAAEGPFGGVLFLGELALNGGIRKVRGVLPVLLHAREMGFERAIIPYDNYEEALVVKGIEVTACRELRDVAALFDRPEGQPSVASRVITKHKNEVSRPDSGRRTDLPDISDVIGQESVKRALVVAASGGHHVLMVGPPGAGKTMLARRFPSLLPPLSEAAAIDTTMIYSAVGLLDSMGLMSEPPFRSPHHSASDAGLIGGGNIPRPGEVTLAHNGVLFMDELPEFKRHVLEVLREPIEEGKITISRAKRAVTFPARFQLIASMNPCPCGYMSSTLKPCRCSPHQVEKYLGKISGPLVDRISIHVFVRPVALMAFSAPGRRDTSQQLRKEVMRARICQKRRYAACPTEECNARAPEALFERFCMMTQESEKLLLSAQRRLRLSARGRAHVIRVARTIADLEEEKEIAPHHLAEAIQYRSRDLPTR